jgi:hypothetical protein
MKDEIKQSMHDIRLYVGYSGVEYSMLTDQQKSEFQEAETRLKTYRAENLLKAFVQFNKSGLKPFRIN